MDSVLSGRFQERLIEMLGHSIPEEEARIMRQVPLNLACSVPVIPERHLVDISGISKN